ncbi:hypothetical protein M3650_29910, partial [Paenibacillus sp. MER TA 81-3]|nr:hypothetical protein [Paenibacillus sp. MER TA 81-3]
FKLRCVFHVLFLPIFFYFLLYSTCRVEIPYHNPLILLFNLYSSNTFIVCEIPQASSSAIGSINYILIPERLIIDYENDLIMAPLRGLENDGRTFPMFDFEGLNEVDVEAYCVRISKIKTEIIKILDEIVDFLNEYEWEEEVYFEKDDDKFMISAFLYEEIDGKISISLSLQLHISGLHPMGDIIFDSEYKTEEDELKLFTDSSDYNLDIEEIQVIFSDCWNNIRRFFLLEKEFEIELPEEINY